MTLSTTNNTASYTGNAVTTAFSFPYLFYANSDLVVKLNGVTKTINTDYTVTGAENPSGGTVTFLSPPSSGASVVIQRIVPYKQDTDFENFDGNPADVTEKQFDLLVMQTQQLAEQTARAILAPIGTSLTTNTISGTINSTTQVLTITTSGPSVSSIADLSTSLDTILTSLSTNDFLQYNGSAWVNRAEPLIQNMQASGSAGIVLQNSGGTTVATFGPANTTNITFAGTVNNTGHIAISGTSSSAAYVTLAEDTDNGTNTIQIIAPAAITANRVQTLPDKDGTFAMVSDIPVGGSGWVPLSTQTISSAVTGVDITSGITSTYKAYKIVGSGIKLSANAQVYLRTSSDGGATFDSGGSDYTYAFYGRTQSTTTSGGNAGTSTIEMTSSNNVGNDVGEGLNFEIIMYCPANSTDSIDKMFDISTTYINDSDLLVKEHMGARRQTTSAINGVRIYASSGNLTAGSITISGLKDA